MESRDKTQLKRQSKYRRKMGKEAAAQAQFVAALSKTETAVQPHDFTMRFHKSSHKMLALMLFGAAMISLMPRAEAKTTGKASSKTKVAPTANTTQELTCQNPETCAPKQTLQVHVEPDVNPVACSYIKKAVLEIKRKLPDAKPMLDAVMAQKDFAALCVDKKILEARRAQGTYDPELNMIMYASMEEAGVGGLAPMRSRVLHHEFLHARKSSIHRTGHCSISLFTKTQARIVAEDTGLVRDLVSNTLLSVTPSPIWPPTSENFELFTEVIRQDIKLGKITDLSDLYKKHYDKKPMTPEELIRYQKYVETLRGVMMYDEPRESILPPAEEKFYIHHPERIPKEMYIERFGAVFIDIKVDTSVGGGLALVGTLKDEISTFLYACKFGVGVFHKNTQQRNRLFAASEMDAHLRTGMPNAAVQLFFPNLWAQLQRDEACCERGEKAKCYTF